MLKYLNVTDTVPLPVGAVNKICDTNPTLETFFFYGLFWDSVYKWWLRLINEDFKHVTFNTSTYVSIMRIKSRLAAENDHDELLAELANANA